MVGTSKKFFAFLFITAVILVGLSTLSLATPTAHLIFDSQPGDPVGQGQHQDIVYVPEGSFVFEASVTRTLPSGEPAYLSFAFLPFLPPFPSPDNFAELEFATDQLGIPIQPGSYFNAERAFFASAGNPGLDVSFNHVGSNILSGNFTITEATFLPGNVINTFVASFEQHSEGLEPALFGTFTYRLSDTENPTIPEPSAWLLLGSGIAGLAFVRNKLRR